MKEVGIQNQISSGSGSSCILKWRSPESNRIFGYATWRETSDRPSMSRKKRLRGTTRLAVAYWTFGWWEDVHQSTKLVGCNELHPKLLGFLSSWMCHDLPAWLCRLSLGVGITSGDLEYTVNVSHANRRCKCEAFSLLQRLWIQASFLWRKWKA